MKHIFIRVLGIAFYLSVSTHQAPADIILTITPNAAVYSPGDSGSLDIFISGQNDELDAFLFGVNITGGSGVVFDDPQNESFLNDSDYVFFGRSSNFINTNPSTFVDPGLANVTIADLSDDGLGGSDPYVFNNDQRLLAQLTFSILSGGTYEFTIDPTSSFSDAAFATINYTSNPASFNVAAVPEPSSWIVLTLGGILPVVFRRANARHKAPGELISIDS